MSEIDPTLDIAKKEFENERMVAFLGPPESGKTVAATLIKRTMYEDFINKHPDYEANVLVGNDFLASTEASMLSGNFPSPTPSLETNEIEFEIARKEPLGKSIKLRIRDISGEDYDILCLGPDITTEERVHNVITKGKGKGRSIQYGPLTYIIFSKLYVIVLDCKDFQNWDKNQLRYSQLLNSIVQFKQAIKQAADGKITVPIAILLTKADRLPDGTSESTEELLKKTMPQFYITLNMLHKGKREYFRVHVEPTPNRDNEVAQEQRSLLTPLQYSADNYSNLIFWIINNMG